MDFTWPDDIRITTLGEVIRAFYEAALEDELTWSVEEAVSLATLALTDYFRRHPDSLSLV